MHEDLRLSKWPRGYVATRLRGHVVAMWPRGYVATWPRGHDLAEMRTLDADGVTELFAKCAEVMVRIEESPHPVIAEVDGIATAAGCQLVASCDLAVASAGSRFATPGVNIGLFCSTPAVPLLRKVASRKHARLGARHTPRHAARTGHT